MADADDDAGEQQQQQPSPNKGGKKRVRIAELPPKQSFAAFSPDNYPNDEDATYLHHDDDIADDAAGSTAPATNETATSGPGAGWTNGQLPLQFTPAITLHPYTRSGRLALYNHHRRWINFQSSWSRIGGENATEMDAVHSTSSSGASVMTGCLVEEGKTVRALVAQLCECFYKAGWATGTGGGVSIRVGGPNENRPYRIFVAPSGVQKEDMVGDDVFELDMERNVVAPPKTPNLRQSACTPLWYVVYQRNPSAMCVIHTHSMHAQMATLLDPSEQCSVLRITHLEMLKGVGNHSYDSILEIPIIDNRPTEDLLAEQLDDAIAKYPKCNAVLVRRHGVYVWGDSWEQAKAQCESFDYLFESAVKMRSMGLDCGLVPKSGTYREEDEQDEEMKEVEEGKKQKVLTSATTTAAASLAPPAFNASGATDNKADLQCSGTIIPLVPRDAKILLLDIEGTTTSISFVKDELFPYILEVLFDYLAALSDDQTESILEQLTDDMTALNDNHPAKQEYERNARHIQPEYDDTVSRHVEEMVKALMKYDVKATGLKALQGDMWEAGYVSGELKGHIYSDVIPMLNWCKENDTKVCIYSSGSIAAQKLLFGCTTSGDILSYFSGHFDTTSGSKRESESYATIAKELGVETEDVIFVSDLEAEIEAADQAGMKVVVAVRPGNATLNQTTKEKYPVVRSLLQLCGTD
ncbi:hypothetical protein ACHAWU_003807 [Discostella pseudostelligera]|uniref:Class II aldolase/adducin N-terminal domain-containing protein n=1 Tax=Discostella pseudostelligera TaxID=259834 RepID=A0ABD3MRS8_9STRA